MRYYLSLLAGIVGFLGTIGLSAMTSILLIVAFVAVLANHPGLALCTAVAGAISFVLMGAILYGSAIAHNMINPT